MVTDPGASSRPDQLRPLNQPRPIEVRTGPDGTPTVLIDRGRHRIAEIQDTWRIDDEWWRGERPLSRRYYRVVLTTGEIRTIYHDREEDAWYAQGY